MTKAAFQDYARGFCYCESCEIVSLSLSLSKEKKKKRERERQRERKKKEKERRLYRRRIVYIHLLPTPSLHDPCLLGCGMKTNIVMGNV